jgi:hypothetical protein
LNGVLLKAVGGTPIVLESLLGKTEKEIQERTRKNLVTQAVSRTPPRQVKTQNQDAKTHKCLALPTEGGGGTGFEGVL